MGVSLLGPRSLLSFLWMAYDDKNIGIDPGIPEGSWSNAHKLRIINPDRLNLLEGEYVIECLRYDEKENVIEAKIVAKEK